MKGIESWQPDLVIAKYAQQMLNETVANEMDPDLIIVRLGKPIVAEKSQPISSVKDGDAYTVSFHRGDFAKKREAQSYARLNIDFDKAVEKAEETFNDRFQKVFLKSSDDYNDAEFIQFQKHALSNLLGNIGLQYGSIKHLLPSVKR